MSTPSSPMAPSAGFKNLRGGLIAFGVFEILIACLCLLFEPLMFFGVAIQARQDGTSVNYAMVVPSMIIYALLAAMFLTLGIGSIRCRRWARHLMLILSWSWLLIGVPSVITDMFLLPRMLAHTVPENMSQLILIVTLGMLSVVFVALPAAFALFYTSRHVKATCEAYNPQPCWTDRCPLPVLAAAAWFAFSTISLLTISLTYNAMPFFGKALAGVPATVVLLVMAGFWGWMTIGFYQLKERVWLIAMVGMFVLMVSGLVSLWRTDLVQFYRLLNMPEQQLKQIQQFDFLTGKNMAIFTAAFAIPMFGYMIWIRKFFRHQPSAC